MDTKPHSEQERIKKCTLNNDFIKLFTFAWGKIVS